MITLNAYTPCYKPCFPGGRENSYDVFYCVIGTYLQAGIAIFTTMNERMQNREVYHIIGEGEPIQNTIGSLKCVIAAKLI